MTVQRKFFIFFGDWEFDHPKPGKFTHLKLLCESCTFEESLHKKVFFSVCFLYLDELDFVCLHVVIYCNINVSTRLTKTIKKVL